MKKNNNINLPPFIVKALGESQNVIIKLGILETYGKSLEDELVEHRHQDNSKIKSLLEKTNEKIFDIVYDEYLDNIQKNSNTIKTKALDRSEFEKKFRKSEFDTNPVALNAVILRYGKIILEQNSKILETPQKNERIDTETHRNSSQNPISYINFFLSNTSTQITSFASEVSEIFKIPPHQPQKNLSQQEPKNIWESGISNLGRIFSFNSFPSFRDTDKPSQNEKGSQEKIMSDPGKEAQKIPSSSPQSLLKDEKIPVAYFENFKENSPLARHALKARQGGQFRPILSKQQEKFLQQNVKNGDGSRRIGG